MLKKPIVIIGAGGIVNAAHLPAYKIAGFQVLGIYDVLKENAQKTAEHFGIANVCDTLSDLVNLAADNNCVYDMATPASAIVPTLEKLPDDIGILIQKPMGEDLAQARQILKLCRDKNLAAGINFQLRHAPNISLARQMIKQGKLGEVHDIEVRVNVFTPWNNWPFLFDLPRMEIVYHSIHYVDLIRSFWGDPESIYAKTVKHPKTPKLASSRSLIIMDYGDMKRAIITTNHGHEFGPDMQESFVKLEGTQGALKMRMGVNLNYPKGLPDTLEYSLIAEGEGWHSRDLDGWWFIESFQGPMTGLMNKLHDADYEFINSVEDAIHTMEAVEACHLSSDRGGVKLSEV